MSVNRQELTVLGQRRGVPVYASNPSIPTAGSIAKRRPKRLGDEQKGLVIDGGSGEILGRGAAIIYEWEEVDQERFVKLFIGGLKKAAGLSKAGLALFEVVYHQMRTAPNSDQVQLNRYMAQQNIKGLTERTYQRGVRELLEREIIYRSPSEGVFFVDINCMFNGDRLAFVKGYHLKTPPKQLDMFNGEQGQEEDITD